MKNEDRLHGLNFGKGTLTVFHLLFVDDSFIFMNANTDDARVLCDILKSYGGPSC